MSSKYAILLVLLLPVNVVLSQQDNPLVLKGRVSCKGRPVPYATLQLQGTSIGVSCNDAGEYVLKIPQKALKTLGPWKMQDTICIRSMGYNSQRLTVAQLQKNGDLHLERHVIELKTVKVSDFRNPRQLLLAVVERIAHNYHQQDTWSTFFYRDWRAVDGELYLFDEAVMDVQRCPYSQYADKRSYLLDPSKREMESNLKTLLRHRLIVYDHKLLETKIIKPRGCDQKLIYSDNEDFFDPVATPQASYILASRVLRAHKFEPIQTFSDNGELYYLVRSVGPCRTKKAQVRYEYTIRKSDLALVRLVSAKCPLQYRAPAEDWVNWYYNTMVVETDSSLWVYDVRDGRYTLTRYLNTKSYRLESHHNGHDDRVQRWHQCLDWVLTDFILKQKDTSCSQVSVYPQPLPGVFGSSNFDSDFWGHYNTIPIDSLPLQLLKDKFHLP